MEPSKTKNEDILSLILNYLNIKGLVFCINENVKKDFLIEFFYPGNTSNKIISKNIIKFSRKGEILWTLEFKVPQNKVFDLSQLADEKRSIYPKEWEKLENSTNKKGGLRRCIYTCLIKEIIEDFMDDSFEFFGEAILKINRKLG